MYPNAPVSEWRCKGKETEKFIRIMELVNPDIDPQDVCKIDDTADDEEEDDSYPGILDQRRVSKGLCLLFVLLEVFCVIPDL